MRTPRDVFYVQTGVSASKKEWERIFWRNVVNEYIINGLADEYDTQSQLLDRGTVVTHEEIDSMIAARCERLHTQRSVAESRALKVYFKEAAYVQQY